MGDMPQVGLAHRAERLPDRDAVLVLGIGNPLMGDDGVGIRCADILAGMDVPDHVHILEAGVPGWGLPNFLAGWQSVVIIDAIDMGKPPGEWRRFRLEDIKLWLRGGELSLHEPDLACGLALTEALNLLPQDLSIYGIQPFNLTASNSLSVQVESMLPGLISVILEDIGINIV